MLKVEDKGVFKVVDGSQVESWTSMGWRLVAVLENDMPMPFSDTENFHTSNSTPVYNMGQQQYGMTPCGYITATNTRYHPTKTQTFLLHLGEDALVADLNYQILNLKNELAEAKEQNKQLIVVEKASAEFEKRLADLITTQAKTVEQVSAGSKALADYKTEVAEKLKSAEEIIARDATRKRTAYEKVVEGAFDDDVEGVEIGAVG